MLFAQAYTSMERSVMHLSKHVDLARHINTLVFHTKMVDMLDGMLTETSDLSVYWFVILRVLDHSTLNIISMTILSSAST